MGKKLSLIEMLIWNENECCNVLLDKMADFAIHKAQSTEVSS